MNGGVRTLLHPLEVAVGFDKCLREEGGYVLKGIPEKIFFEYMLHIWFGQADRVASLIWILALNDVGREWCLLLR